MAKWGEGDPRWIVEERPDATNVNNWHWTEKNASSWSRDKLKELLVGLEINDGKTGSVTITGLSKCDGEASANNRKAKLIFFYEWELKASWKGSYRDKTDIIEGEITIPNLSDENDVSEIDMTVNVTSGDKGDALKEMVRKYGAGVVQTVLASYVRDLKQEFSQGMILPNKNATHGPCKINEEVSPISTKSKCMNVETSAAAKHLDKLAIGTKVSVTELKETHSFKCTAEEFYNALTVKELVQAFTQSRAELDVRQNGRFELLSGSVQGVFVQLEPCTKIVMKWRLRNWPQEHYSEVTIDINQQSDSTQVSLKQVSIPSSELENTRLGWTRYYWEAMRRTFGFGASLV